MRKNNFLGCLLFVFGALASNITIAEESQISRHNYATYIGDHNNDGYEDVLLKHYEKQSLIQFGGSIVVVPITHSLVDFVLTQDSSGNYSMQSAPSSALVNHTSWERIDSLALEFIHGDFDGDGVSDVLLASTTDDISSFVILADNNLSQSVLSQTIDSAVYSFSLGSASIQVADNNSDGQDDVILSIYGSVITLLSDTSGVLVEQGGGNNPPVYGIEVASISGNFNVTNAGAATYSIPIEVPPGIAGLEPELALNYNSQGANGVFGVGWNISGMSNFHRCPPTMARDQEVDGIDFNNSDRFCFDSQPLILVSGSVYGEDQSTYRTEIDNFAEITLHDTDGINGPNYFVVETKSGLIMEYGNTTESYFNPPLHNSTVQPVAVCWLLNETRDRMGNYMLFEYAKDEIAGSSMPTKILYTGHSSGITPFNEIEFKHESRADQLVRYIGGRKTKSDQRVSSIEIKNEGVLISEYRFAYDQDIHTGESTLNNIARCDGANNCVQATSFDFQEGIDGSFAARSISTNNATISTADDARRRMIVDINSDGLPDVYWVSKSNSANDLVYLQNQDGSFTATSTASGVISGADYEEGFIQFGDFNGDGNIDVFRIKGEFVANPIHGFVNNTLEFNCPPVPNCNPPPRPEDVAVQFNKTYENYIYYGRGDGTFESPVNAPVGYIGDREIETLSDLPFGGTQSSFQLFKNYDELRYRLGDFNGDGRTDFLYINYNPQTYSADIQHTVYLSNNSGGYDQVNNTGITTNITAEVDNGSIGVINDFNRIQLGDFNGDGQSDVYYIKDGIDRVFLSNGNATFSAINGPHTTISSNERSVPLGLARIKFADLNGDGLTDVIDQGFNGDSTTTIKAFLSSGASNFTQVSTGVTVTSEDDWEDGTTDFQRLFFGDFNGDGLSDIYYSGAGDNNQSNRIHYSKGNGTFTAPVYPSNLPNVGNETVGVRQQIFHD